MHDPITKARQVIKDAKSLAVLTGAGISAESGLPTFRGQDGYWQGLSATELASPRGFARDPYKVWEWYNLRRQALWQVRPNPGHYALAELEKKVERFGLITQNVDRLHQAAGSRQLLELHGNLCEVRCVGCGAVKDRTGVALPSEPRCEVCGEWLRPAVVWFGEDLPAGVMAMADRWVSEAEVFLVVGTSAVVYPAAGLVYTARDAGATVIEINLEETPATEVADIFLPGKSGEILPQLVTGSSPEKPLAAGP